jgi:hypothetical protein
MSIPQPLLRDEIPRNHRQGAVSARGVHRSTPQRLALLNRLRRLAQREFNRAGDEGNPPKADKRSRWAFSDSLNGILNRKGATSEAQP